MPDPTLVEQALAEAQALEKDNRATAANIIRDLIALNIQTEALATSYQEEATVLRETTRYPVKASTLASLVTKP
jgi:hypothetical protein